MQNSFTSSFKRYLVRLLVAQGVLLLAALGASMALVRYYVEPNDRVIKSLDLIQRETARDAAFGDSHFAWGFVGTPDFPTLGAEGETNSDMELRVRYYYRNKQPGRVVIQGDPHSFSAYKLERATHAYLDNMDNEFWQRFLEHHRPFLGLYWQRVLSAGKLDVFRPSDDLRWGWIVGHEQWTRTDSTARVNLARARYVHQAPDPGFQKEAAAQSYQRTLAFLRQRGADVCVVTTPVSYEYYQFAGRDSSTEAAIRYVRLEAEQAGARYVDYFDYYARPEFSNYFRDMDHLNEIGAPRFTARVLADCFPPKTGSLGSTRHEGR